MNRKTNYEQTITGRTVHAERRRAFCRLCFGAMMMWFARRSSALSLRANKLSEVSTSLTPAVRRFQGGEVPLVRIDLIKGKSQDYRTKVGDIVYQTLIDVLNVPEHDRFHVITEHSKSDQPFDRQYAGISRSDDCIFFQITLNSGRSVELKQSFYKALAERLNEGVGLRKEDTFINLVEVPKENWSFGNGEAQYASVTH